MPSCCFRMRAQCRLWSMPASRRTASFTSACPAPPSKTSRSVGTLRISLPSLSSLICCLFIHEAKNCWICVRQVQIRPWNLNDSDFVMDGSQPLDPRKTIFVGGVPRPLRAGSPNFYCFYKRTFLASGVENENIWFVTQMCAIAIVIVERPLICSQ